MAGKAKNVRLWQEIALALAIKIFALSVIWAVWFSAPEGARLDDQSVASQILSHQIQKEHDHDAIGRTR